MLGPFDVGAAEERIRALVATLRLVGTAGDVEAAMAATAPPPAAFVVLGAETPGPKSGASSGVTIQPVDATFGVLLKVRNYRASDAGAAAIDGLAPVITAVRGAVVGWTPQQGTFSGCSLAGARLQKYDAQTLWWLESFRSTYQLRHVH